MNKGFSNVITFGTHKDTFTSYIFNSYIVNLLGKTGLFRLVDVSSLLSPPRSSVRSLRTEKYRNVLGLSQAVALLFSLIVFESSI